MNYGILILFIVCIMILYRTVKSRFTTHTPLYLFWHIGALEGKEKRLIQILTRQWDLINSSGLYDRVDGIYVGIVGPERPTILLQIMNDPKVYVIKDNETSPSSHECYTTEYLWRFCKGNPNSNVIYIHSRGITHKEMKHTDDWTKMMEYFNIEKWRDNEEWIKEYLTLGCEMLGNNVHYSGNFWWAKASYINRLSSPYKHANNGTNRYACGEFWILTDPNIKIKDHKGLFSTEPDLVPQNKAPKHDIYKDKLPPSKYMPTYYFSSKYI